MTAESPTKPWWRRWFGDRSERAAARYLRSRGFRIVKRNYRCAAGEIDLIGFDGDCLVFVEVRSTEKPTVAGPAASVNLKKQQRLTRAALTFLQEQGWLGMPARFDVLAISWPTSSGEPVIEHHSGAFDAVGRFQPYS